jgi:malate dehydrogenase (oxaloacetate-decarboxylating)(NADP+)
MMISMGQQSFHLPLLNALELAEKKIENAKIIVSVAGSAALACANLYVQLGVSAANIMFDKDGVLSNDRTDLSLIQNGTQLKQKSLTLAEAIKKNVFFGLSAGNVLSADMLLAMADNPVVFAMANPVPEIDYHLAKATRTDIIMATGRSDYLIK